MINRVPSGITGLDELIEGGFVEGTVNLISGKAGTSKTIMCAQFLYNGATKYGEKGLYITSEETKASLIRAMQTFGWDFEDLEKKKMVKILEVQPFEAKIVISKITEAIESMDIQRLYLV